MPTKFLGIVTSQDQLTAALAKIDASSTDAFEFAVVWEERGNTIILQCSPDKQAVGLKADPTSKPGDTTDFPAWRESLLPGAYSGSGLMFLSGPTKLYATTKLYDIASDEHMDNNRSTCGWAHASYYVTWQEEEKWFFYDPSKIKNWKLVTEGFDKIQTIVITVQQYKSRSYRNSEEKIKDAAYAKELIAIIQTNTPNTPPANVAYAFLHKPNDKTDTTAILLFKNEEIEGYTQIGMFAVDVTDTSPNKCKELGFWYGSGPTFKQLSINGEIIEPSDDKTFLQKYFEPNHPQECIFLGIVTSTEQLLKALERTRNRHFQVFEYALAWPDHDQAIIVRCSRSHTMLELGDTPQSKASLAIQHDLDFTQHSHAWLAAFLTADAPTIALSFDLPNTRIHALATRCTLASAQRVLSLRWRPCWLHGKDYLTWSYDDEAFFLPAPDGGFVHEPGTRPASARPGLLQQALLRLNHAEPAEGQDQAPIKVTPQLLMLPTVWPDAKPHESRADDIAVLSVYLSDDKSTARVCDPDETKPSGYTETFKVMLDVHATPPEALRKLVREQWSGWGGTLSVGDQALSSDANNPSFLASAFPNWSLPSPPRIINWHAPHDTVFDDRLPCTLGFGTQYQNAGDTTWHSPCRLLADRPLADGEKIHVFVQNDDDGTVLQQITLEATLENNRADQWPNALARHVNETRARHSSMSARVGHADETGHFAINPASPDSITYDSYDETARSHVNRLWTLGTHTRIYSTAPFYANQVCAARLPSTDLLPQTRLCVQVRDLATQYLYEQHLFVPGDHQLGSAQWQRALCARLNLDSQRVKAGSNVRGTAWILPSGNLNGLWVPQESELSVTVQALNWQRYSTLNATQGLSEGQVVRLFAHDPATGTPLPGSPLVFKPTKTQCAKDKWPAALAEALKASKLSDYLRLGVADTAGSDSLAAGATTATWWALDLPLRIWFSEPAGPDLVWEEVLDHDDKPVKLSDLYRQPYHNATLEVRDRRTLLPLGSWTYEPAKTGLAEDKATWMQGLYRFLKDCQAACIAVSASQPEHGKWDAPTSDSDHWKLWVARQADMVVSLVAHDAARFVPVAGSYYDFNPTKFPGPWETINLYSGVPLVDPASLYQSPTSRVTVVLHGWHKPETIYQHWDYIPAEDGSITDKTTWLKGFYRMLVSHIQINFITCISVCPNEPTDKQVFDISEPENCKVWLRRQEHHPVMLIQKASCDSTTSATTVNAPAAPPAFGELGYLKDHLLKETSFLLASRVLARGQSACMTTSEVSLDRLFREVDHDLDPDDKPRLNIAEKKYYEALADDNYYYPEDQADSKMIFFVGNRSSARRLANLSSGGDYNTWEQNDGKLLSLVNSIIPSKELPPSNPHHSAIYTDTELDTWLRQLTAAKVNYTLNFRRTLSDSFEELDRWLLAFDNTVYKLTPLECSGRELSVLVESSGGSCQFRLRLLPEAFAKGVRLLFAREETGANLKRRAIPVDGTSAPLLSIGLHLPVEAFSDDKLALAWAGYVTQQSLAEGGRVLTIKAPIHGKAFLPADPLCADNSSTDHSEPYDTTGATENGVDPRTGLFHAHYPVATLQGLKGQGPVVDLTLHYSARRANESALGDGWAFRFSSYDNRLRILTLASGQTLQLFASEVHALCTKPAATLEKGFCRLSDAKGDNTSDEKNTALTRLTITYLSGRKEVLSLPGDHDGIEANEAFKGQITARLKRVSQNWRDWVEKEDFATVRERHVYVDRLKATEESIRDINRKAFILTPSSIVSPQGGELTLKWKGVKGHVQLQSVEDGKTCLLQATQPEPVATGPQRCSFIVWPGTPEEYEVKLDIQDCLLKKLTRTAKGASAPVQTVEYGYQGDLAFDRLLSSIHEEDGSLETVTYQPQVAPEDPESRWSYFALMSKQFGIPMPRVSRHTMVPGAGQATLSHRWTWFDPALDASLPKDTFSSRETLEVPSLEGAPFTERRWCIRHGMQLPAKTIEETPALARRSTTHTYPDSVNSTDARVESLLLGQPTATEVRYDDLRMEATQESKA